MGCPSFLVGFRHRPISTVMYNTWQCLLGKCLTGAQDQLAAPSSQPSAQNPAHGVVSLSDDSLRGPHAAASRVGTCREALSPLLALVMVSLAPALGRPSGFLDRIPVCGDEGGDRSSSSTEDAGTMWPPVPWAVPCLTVQVPFPNSFPSVLPFPKGGLSSQGRKGYHLAGILG